ncbi:MAG TPA: hypothetical protein VH302_11240 [Bryobacteraceae bacterium]|jgi:hypothetical protein|nr:hypothetical protein [Bryobacteraceae bacterium]
MHTFGVWMLVPIVFLLFACPAACAQETAPETRLAIVQAGVQQSEDAPFVSANYTFLPGDYLYFTFEIAGFTPESLNRDEVHKIALTYRVTPEDTNGVPLTEPAQDSIKTDLSAEDKNWTPKRRTSFLLPSYLAAGDFRVHVQISDLIAKTEVSKDFPFHVGGTHITPAPSLNVQHFEFLRRESDRDALEIPAYSPGDTVFARFDMAAFKLAAGNTYSLEYGLSVIQPSGKPFLDAPHAAELKASSFYPAQFLPGVIHITTPANSAKGNYLLTLTVHDLIGNTQFEIKKSFSIE